MFESAVDAAAALSDLHDDAERADGFRQLVGAWPDGPVAAATAAEQPRQLKEQVARPSLTGVVERVEASHREQPERTRRGRWMYWGAALVAIVAIAEAGFIGRLLYGRVMTPPTLPSTKPPETIRTESPALLPIDQGSLGSSADETKLTAAKTSGATTAAPGAFSTSQRNGGMRLTASFEIHARLLRDVLRECTDPGEIVREFDRRTESDMVEVLRITPIGCNNYPRGSAS